MSENDLLDWLTLCVAVIGLTLGIVNSIYGVLKKRVKLRVVTKVAFRSINHVLSTKNRSLIESINAVSINVTNLSEFTIFIDEIGLHRIKANRAVITGDY